MANVVTKSTFKNMLPYLPGDVSDVLSALFLALPRDVQLSESLSLYVADAVHTIVEIDDDAGSYPLALVVKSNGTLCSVLLYADDSGDVTVGTTDSILQVGVTATSGEISAAIAVGSGYKSLANVSGADGLSIAAPATTQGTGAVANDPTCWVLYHNA